MRNNRYLFYVLAFFALLCFVIIFSFTTDLITIKQLPQQQEAQWSLASTTDWGKVEILRHYLLCNHITQEEFSLDFSQSNLIQLQKVYPSQEGWTYEQDSNKIRFSQEIEELCPQDAQKRHVAVVGDFLAVFQGPVGAKGKLERITDIKIKNLPLEWQEKVYKGHLSFADEVELLEALDSLDEYLSVE